MLQLKELYKFCLSVGLMAEEVVFLYTLYARSDAPDDIELRDYFKAYQVKNQYYLINGESNIPVMWKDMAQRLITLEFIDDLRSQEEVKSERFLINKLRVTSKFTKLILLEDKEHWWDLYIDIWKENAPETPSGMPYVLGTDNIHILLPDKGNPKVSSIEKMIDYFWVDLCDNGQKYNLGKLYTDTEQYLQENGANMKVCTFLLNYKQMFKAKKK